MLIQDETAKLAILLRQVDDGTAVDMRSREGYDLVKIAIEMGGGGHPRAAGFTLRGLGLNEAKQIVLEKLRHALN